MHKMTLDQAIHKIESGQPFSAEVAGCCRIKVDAYLPVVATAIHAGHQLRPELASNLLLSDAERLYEEDPATDRFIASQPITLVGCDSRFEYDLNRPRSLSTYYRSAWNRRVWRRALGEQQRATSHRRHATFYRLYDALIDTLERIHRHVLVYDIHSYNYRRIGRATPTFNVGTAQIDMERWGAVVRRFTRELGRLPLPGTSVEAKLNQVFQGRGYLIAHTNARFDRTLVLPTEVKKVYMDELEGSLYPAVVDQLSLGLREAFSETAAYFQRHCNKRPKVGKPQMLSPQIEPAVVALDRQLAELSRGLETLPYLNPVNLDQERRRFLERDGRHPPQFRYKPLRLDPFAFREQLFSLPFERICDPAVRRLYQDVADNLSRRVDMLTTVGSEEFRYASLRYYSRPNQADLQRARFLLQAAPLPVDGDGAQQTAEQAREWLQQQAREMGLDCKISLSANLAAKAMVTGGRGKPQLRLNRDRRYGGEELEALRVHELGVHVATTVAGRRQPLKLLNIGLPGNTQTQEGLAILAEYCAGALPLGRLKTLAARTVAVESMLSDNHFGHTWSKLREEAGLSAQDAFDLAVRVYRAGGLTKDFQYLTGFMAILESASRRDLGALLCGKTSLGYLDLMQELCGRGWLVAPAPLVKLHPEKQVDPILGYLIQSLALAA